MLNNAESAAELLNKQYAESDINELLSEHKEILAYTNKIGIYWMICGMLYWISYCSRWYLWILFTRDLHYNNETNIAISVNIIYLVTAASNLFWSPLGDKYTFSSIAIIACIATLIALIIEASAIKYIMLVIGSLITASFRVMNVLSLAFLAKYLPSSLSIKYTSYFCAMLGCSNLLGPIFAGLISYTINIRAVFIFSAIIAAVKLLIVYFMIHRTENKINSKQLKLKSFYKYIKTRFESDDIDTSGEQFAELLFLSDEKNQFPICTETYYLQQESSTKNKYIWLMVILITVASACILSAEGVIATFYVIFCVDLFNAETITATTHVFVVTIGYILGMLIAPKLIKKFKDNNNINNFTFEYSVLFITHIIVILLLYFFIYKLKQNAFFWLWFFDMTIGFGAGFVAMIQEAIFLIIQPKKYAGSISGIKGCVRYVCRAIICFIIGYYMQYNYYWFIYGIIILYIASLIIMTLSTLLYCFYSQN